MGRSRLKKCRKIVNADETHEKTEGKLINNLPDKLLIMRVKSGTKIRNVFQYSIKEFTKYEGVLWTGGGQAVGKVITCAEMFKRQYKCLHQITKLQYIESKKNSEADTDQKQVPEIHIYLTKNPLNSSELGYQQPHDTGNFQNSSADVHRKGQNVNSNISGISTEEFAKMGLRTGQKRPRKNVTNKTPTKSKKARVTN
ncbi:ribonuclease P protein subunit p25-like protein [Fopius arisanus]|uniref:Ribonuclease P protein subunit p25-like protein n=1 Tax=Fopius arisanus TaxID=64838 RepID=A0A9R1SU95_9HYME|nr:PREDICTED: ribonuclease P protein subunit p25-like protein [Fopius arisanus]XP_011297266.1 PREDICTED: ribonuclease P protein subunit p25-like protein [Fopius arisanus]